MNEKKLRELLEQSDELKLKLITYWLEMDYVCNNERWATVHSMDDQERLDYLKDYDVLFDCLGFDQADYIAKQLDL